ncbi:UDP-glucose:protein N-beta-glucosyltransferase [Pasteurella sp. PK-2025]|uniref:UDP-glucose:protein N-beta-glucosyltransferase n=1 Tax=Pasteurella sp. PK-2025 TaxID=3413133 RepID=UPI003C7803AD
MTEQKSAPCVMEFEHAVAKKEYEKACSALLSILNKLDTNFGTLAGIEFDAPEQILGHEHDETVYFCTRMAMAITTLFQDPKLEISQKGFLSFITLQRWLHLIFASSPFINADHILQTYNTKPDRDSLLDIHISSDESALFKFCLLYFPESNVNLSLDTLWEVQPKVCAALMFALQSPRFLGTRSAFNKRSAILQWFPEKLATLNGLHGLPSGITHDVYMHCSYDIAPNKHQVKKALNKVIRQHLLDVGWVDRDVSQIGKRHEKPVMVVLLEHFHASHSIYRTHSTSMIAARQHFHLIGLGGEAVDKAGQAVFDEFHLLEGNTIFDKLILMKKICEENGAAILYMPSIGMDLVSIFASNCRVAPIQAIALGHPATTYSDFIEYVIVEDDYVGSEACFSETLLRLPKDALPYVPSASAPTHVEYRLRENPDVVHIGIAATTMKLNPYFLEALYAITTKAKVKVHFHFALGQSQGITHPYIERFIKSYLGEFATVHPQLPYHAYLSVLHDCDMMLNPFPFGNTNGIIDMITLGLVGVCKTGDEVHEHIDEGLFKRLGLPDWLIAHSAEEYVERALRLAENHEERLALRRHIIEKNGLQTLFTGDPSPMGNILLEKLNEWLIQQGQQPLTTAAKKTKGNRKGTASTPSADNAPAEKTPRRRKSTSTKATSEVTQKVSKKKASEPKKTARPKASTSTKAQSKTQAETKSQSAKKASNKASN